MSRRRISITFVVVLALLAEDLIVGWGVRSPFDFHDTRSTLCLVLVCLGLAIRTCAAGTISKNREVTTSGVYAIVRHPLYFGSMLIILGFCLLTTDPENLPVMGLLTVLLYGKKIAKEERNLRARFGAQWDEYSRRTPCLIPYKIFTPIRLNGWSFARWRSVREYACLTAASTSLILVHLLSQATILSAITR